MPKLKAVLTFVLLSVFILSLSGCGMLPSDNSETESEVAGFEAGLPEWLLLSYRSNRDLQAEEDEEPVLPKDVEEDEADEEQAPPEPAPETAAPVEQPVSQPAPSSPPEEPSAPAEEEVNSGGLTKSQQMLADSWKRKQDQGNDDEEDEDEDDVWWNPKKDNFTHDIFD